MTATGPVDVGAAIRAQRKALGWSQARLAAAVRIARAGLAMRELGKAAVTVDELLRIAAALGTTPAVLLGEPGPASAPAPAPAPEPVAAATTPVAPEHSTIAETCRCGGSLSVTGGLDAAREEIKEWRGGHLDCRLTTPQGAGFRIDPGSTRS